MNNPLFKRNLNKILKFNLNKTNKFNIDNKQLNNKRDKDKILNLNKITFLLRVLTRYLPNTTLITLNSISR